jgi:predicted MFS family arabinose efflux permease
MPGHRRLLLPLVLATLATQASIVVLAPIVVEVADDFGASVSGVGIARSVMAGTAVVGSLALGSLIDRLGVRPILVWGGVLALAGAGATAAAPSLAAFYAVHVVVGAGIACLLSAGFAGVGAYFDESESARAMGYVVGAQSLAWIVGNPVIGILTDAVSWRLAYVVPALAAAGALLAGLGAPRGAVVAAADGERRGLGAVVRDVSARRWTVAELVAYSAWTAELTYVGAFYVRTYDIEESAVGFLLAVGSFAFLASTLNTDRLTRRFGRRTLVVGGAVGMGTLAAVLMNVTPSVWFTVGMFCLVALCAGLRSTGSSALGLDQLPAQPGSMMAARTASAQLGYMIGAGAGGAILAVSGFGALGFALLAGMLASAVLISRVAEPLAETGVRRRGVPEPVPD